jgi:hypothetical protein
LNRIQRLTIKVFLDIAKPLNSTYPLALAELTNPEAVQLQIKPRRLDWELMNKLDTPLTFSAIFNSFLDGLAAISACKCPLVKYHFN